jgi:acyl carrier protein
MLALETTIRDYIQRSLLEGSLLDEGQTAIELPRDQDLLALLDSLQILRMLLDLESQLGVKVENSELTPENLGTIERLAAFLARKQVAAAVLEGQPS